MDNTLLIRTLADEQELLRAATLTLDAEAQALRSEERLAQTPEQVLQRHGKAEGAAIPTGFRMHRQLEKAHGRARTEDEHYDEGAAGNDKPGHL